VEKLITEIMTDGGDDGEDGTLFLFLTQQEGLLKRKHQGPHPGTPTTHERTCSFDSSSRCFKTALLFSNATDAVNWAEVFSARARFNMSTFLCSHSGRRVRGGGVGGVSGFLRHFLLQNNSPQRKE
jgi:hypothetical protein